MGSDVTPRRSKEHYSYSAYADPKMARTFDDRRFAGPIGELIAGTQARVVANMVGRIKDRIILDVGTGTGRAALMLARGGARERRRGAGDPWTVLSYYALLDPAHRGCDHKGRRPGGERPASEMPAYLLAADVLVSPRSRGTNTPLKIYQYLRSGKPIVATRLRTHTQVLNDETAILTGITAQEFADGILAGLNDHARAASVGRRAREVADTKYSYEAYLDRTRQACAALMPAPPAAAIVKDVA